MTAAPQVCVITPVYNGARYLREALDSVTSQDYPNFEHVIIDNCSDDETPAIAAEFAARDPRVRVVRNDRLVDVIENHNIAFRTIGASSAYCKVLHADDRLEPGCLARMVALGERYPRAGVLGSYSKWGDRVFPESIPVDEPLFAGHDLCRRALLGEFYPFLSPSTLTLRSELVRARDPFYRGKELHADLAAYYEVLSEWDFAFQPEPLVMIRQHDESVTSARAKPMNRLIAARLQMLATYGPRYLSEPEYAAILARRIDDYYRFLANSLLVQRDPAFWELHERALARAGAPLERGRLARTVFGTVAQRPVSSACRFLKSLGG